MKNFVEVVCGYCGTSFQADVRGNAKYCQRACMQKAHYERRMLDYTFRLAKLCAMAKNRASAKGLPFNLTSEYLIDLWEESEGCCVLSGISFELDRPDKGKVHPYAPSIDKIEPAKGYIKGNVRLVCYQMNVALSEFGIEQFDALVDLYVSYRKQV